MSTHPYQLHSIAISKDFKAFFNKSYNNIIKFWDCFDSIKWSPHLLVDKKTKHLKINPVFFRKSLWEIDRKEEYDSIMHK